MFIQKNYAHMTLAELGSQEKKRNAQKIPFALFIGFLVGMAVWSATHHAGFVVTVLWLLSAGLSGGSMPRTWPVCKRK